MTLSYVEAHYVINKANEIFGYDGWSMEIENLDVKEYSYTKNNKSAVSVLATAQVRVTVKVPEKGEPDKYITRLDVGSGSSISYSGVPDIEGAVKEAVSDAMKRSFRTFGSQFGNTLYDKEFLKELDKTGKVSVGTSKGHETPDSPVDNPATERQKIAVANALARVDSSLAKEFPGQKVYINTLTKDQASAILTKYGNRRK